MEEKEELLIRARELHEQQRQIDKEIQEISEKLDYLELREVKGDLINYDETRIN